MSEEGKKKFGELITRLINGENLKRSEARDAMEQVLQDRQTGMHQGAFLASLAAKGETREEIAGTWDAVFQLDTVKAGPKVTAPLVENSGTGMDAVKTFNISTAAALVAAAAGVPMARHGARAITSSCGTVDLLEELGLDVECEAGLVDRSIEKAGIGIYNGMSPEIHPRALGRILSQISFGTVLNLAASLANPAMPEYAVRGVHSLEMLETAPQVMGEIGYKKALVLHGLDGDGKSGMDEASILGETRVAELREDGSVVNFSFTPEDVGLSRGEKQELAPHQDRKKEAARMITLLQGREKGAREDAVSLNAALVLFLVGKSSTITEGINFSREIIRSGRAVEKLKEWIECQNHTPEKGLSRLQELSNQVAG